MQVLAEPHVAAHVAHAGEGDRRDRHQPRGQSVEPVGEVHRVRGAGDDQDHERNEQHAEVEDAEFQEGHVRGGGRQAWLGEAQQDDPDQATEHDLSDQLVAAEQALGEALHHPQVVVDESQRAEPHRGEHRQPHRARVEVPHNTVGTKIAVTISRPPIVGVPDLERWLCGPSSRIF